MYPVFQDYLERLTDLHKGILNALEDLPPGVLDWTPIQETTGDMNSINVLGKRISAALNAIGSARRPVADPSGQMRADEFQVSGMDAAGKKIESATAYAQSALKKLALDELALEKSRLRDGRPVRWAGRCCTHSSIPLSTWGIFRSHVKCGMRNNNSPLGFCVANRVCGRQSGNPNRIMHTAKLRFQISS